MAKGDSAPATENQDIAQMSFEEALEALQQIVARLEKGEGKLDEAIDAYQRGAALKQHCEAKLRQAQEKIAKISLDAKGEPKAEAFDLE